LLTAFALGCGGSGGTADAESEIREVTRRWEAALIAGDAAGAVESVFTADAVRLPANEPAVRGATAIRQALSGSVALRSARFDLEDLDVSGDLAYAAGTYSVSVTGEEELSGKFLEVWKRTPAGWRIHRVMWD
jgi:ketosteroid isomerase-like protein